MTSALPTAEQQDQTVRQGGRRLALQDHEKSNGLPLISIITAVRNAENLIGVTLRSIQAQTYPNIEYVVIDGKSSDGTVDILRRCEDTIDYWVSETDAGLYYAMNKGVALCHGDLVSIIGAGDWFEKDAIANIATVYQKSGADVIYGDVVLVDAETGIAHLVHSCSELMPKSMSSINHPATFVKRTLFSNPAFDTSFRIAADYDFCLGLYLAGRNFLHSGATITHIRTGGASSSPRTLEEVFRVHQRHYGTTYALRQFIVPFLRLMFLQSRRRLLRIILPGEQFTAVRTWWMRRKQRRTKLSGAENPRARH